VSTAALLHARGLRLFLRLQLFDLSLVDRIDKELVAEYMQWRTKKS